jgi:hypothetical protein
MKKEDLLETYLDLARANGLSYPTGRAFYMSGRHWNGGLGRYGLSFEIGGFGPKKLPKSLKGRRVAALKTIREDTAERWQRHAYNGGSPKGLKYTEVEWNRYRQTTRYDTKQNNPTGYKGNY